MNEDRRWARRLAFCLMGACVLGPAKRAQAAVDSPGDDAPTVVAAPQTADPQKDAPGPSKLTWKDGRTTFETDKFSISLSNRIQFRWTDVMPDSQTLLLGAESPGDSKGSFRIRRAKTRLDGWFWRKEIQFDFQVGWAGSDSSGGSSTFSGIEDAALILDVSGNKSFEVKLGQFKVPFGRQELTSSEDQQFIDRSLLSGEFTLSRDVGVAVQGLLVDKKVEYRAGIFNGNGRNKVENDNTKYQYNAMVTYQPWGEVGYSESDFESKNKPLAAGGVEFQSNNQQKTTVNANNADTTTWGLFGVVKYKGFFGFGEYFLRKKKPEIGPEFNSPGAQVQAGYFLKRDQWEVAIRYAWWDPSELIANNIQTEIGAALNYYYLRHNLKAQADFRQLEDKARSMKTKEFRIQAQFVF